MLNLDQCRTRQKRLINVLQRRKLDAAVCGLDWHVYYFTGFRRFWFHQSAAVIFSDGRSWLTTANDPTDRAAADTIDSFVAQHMATLRQEQPNVVAEQVIAQLKAGKARRIGVDTSQVSARVMLGFDGSCEAIDDELWQMRRVKDADELELLRRSIRCTEAMHKRAREIVEPGVDELHVFNELHAAAVEAAGEPLSGALGNDYACGALGGLPRQGRKAKAGELYIFDLGPERRGYRADNTRTISVDRNPTDAQAQAWQRITDALEVVEQTVKPGTRGKQLFAMIDQFLQDQGGTPLMHHLGHGIGLQPHEFPHLNPHWDDEFMAGEVICVEPGQYGQELAQGIRLENQYLITADGMENLVSAPLELA